MGSSKRNRSSISKESRENHKPDEKAIKAVDTATKDLPKKCERCRRAKRAAQYCFDAGHHVSAVPPTSAIESANESARNSLRQNVDEPSKTLPEPLAVVDDCAILESPPAINPDLDRQKSSAPKTEVSDFDIAKLMDYYQNYGVDCLVPRKN
jgi:hypothetical protein